jgi:1-acyl-sn-glycerol-3-phosphate acyltransferase
MAKDNQWVKLRHKIITKIGRPIVKLWVQWKYHIRIDVYNRKDKRPMLIVMNHQTGFDQFFVASAFDRPVYYLASEDIFSLGWVSDLIRWLVAPIPIKKQTTDLQAVKNCIRVAREGGTICIAPEGHRTFHGKTVYMKPGIASLAKKLGMPIAIFRLDGGYGIQPRWSDVVRGGTMHAYVKRVIEPEEFSSMTPAQLMKMLEQELWVDEAKVTGRYPHKKNAEFLERLVYTCPKCGFAPFESTDDIIRCTTCGMKVRHLDTKELEGVDEPFPHRFVSDWYDAQNELVNSTDLTALTEEPIFRDEAELRLVHVYKYKELLKEKVQVCLYGDRITLDEEVIPLGEAGAVTVLGKNKINIYHGDRVLQLKGSKRFNAVKYVNFFHRYQNIKTGDTYGKFLGF